jgi:hypothetical protein
VAARIHVSIQIILSAAIVTRIFLAAMPHIAVFKIAITLWYGHTIARYT